MLEFVQYWIVNLPERQVEVYSNPADSDENPDYLQRQTYQEADAVPVVVDNVSYGTLAVADLLP